MLTVTIDGREIYFFAQTEFKVQVGRYSKGAYKTKYSFTGNIVQAFNYYNGINIGRGYKKRLVMVGANKPVLAKQSS
jgi:hypothetical protein